MSNAVREVDPLERATANLSWVMTKPLTALTKMEKDLQAVNEFSRTRFVPLVEEDWSAVVSTRSSIELHICEDFGTVRKVIHAEGNGEGITLRQVLVGLDELLRETAPQEAVEDLRERCGGTDRFNELYPNIESVTVADVCEPHVFFEGLDRCGEDGVYCVSAGS